MMGLHIDWQFYLRSEQNIVSISLAKTSVKFQYSICI